MRTLIERVKKMPLNPEIVNWSLYQLGKLEGGTSQWQTAAILNGNTEVLLEVPFYLRKTYDIKTKWKSKRDAGEIWEVPRDPTLITQSEDYLIFLETGQIRTKPEKLGDCDLYCFLRTFGVVEREWGEKNWPQLAEHESNRLETTDIMISQKENGETIVSDDHRIVQAAAMKIQAEAFRKGTYLPVEEIKQRFSNPNCVAKKWPEFWKAMDYFPKAALEGY
jgi:hypothetical protein